METVIRHTFPDNNENEWTVDAIEVAPGLLIYEIPAGVSPDSALRWTLGHHSGRAIAVAMYEDDVREGARKAAAVADWTGTADEVRARVLAVPGAAESLYDELSRSSCSYPGDRAYA